MFSLDLNLINTRGRARIREWKEAPPEGGSLHSQALPRTAPLRADRRVLPVLLVLLVRRLPDHEKALLAARMVDRHHRRVRRPVVRTAEQRGPRPGRAPVARAVHAQANPMRALRFG